MKYWLMKSEPGAYSIDDLARDDKTLWTGIRNYQARNSMTQDMKVGDPVIFYHSNAEPPGVAGLARVSAAAVPDPTQFDRALELFEPRATVDVPVWRCVQVEFVAKARTFVPLEALRAEKSLAKMELLRKGSRLSIQPVQVAAFRKVMKLAGIPA